MATARIQLQGHVDGLLGGDFPFSFLIQLADALGSRMMLTLPAGDNDITSLIPDGTTFIVAIPPDTTPADPPWKLKGQASDTGMIMLGNQPFVVSRFVDNTDVVITVAADLDNLTLIFV